MEIILIIAAVIGTYVYFNSRGNKFIADDSSFSQKGVTVDFASGNLILGTRTFPVHSITAIKTDEVHRREKLLRTATVKIEIDDLGYPIHQVNFLGFSAHDQAQVFAQRLSVAVRKAGGPSFR